MTKEIEEQDKIVGIGIIAKLANGSHYQVLVSDSEADIILNYISNMTENGNIKLQLPALTNIQIT